MTERQNRFKTSLRKHSRLLTIISAFIVFVTFIVKEGLADQWKDQASAIDMAEYIYAIQADTSQTVAAQKFADVHSFQNKVIFEKHNGPETLYERDWQDGYDYLVKIEVMLVSMRNIEIVIDKLPRQGSHRKELEQLIDSRII
jgi:hypothetical protein